MFHLTAHAGLINTQHPSPAPSSAGIHTPTFGFLPAFRDLADGETHLCTNADGSLSNVHLFDHLPAHWVEERDDLGRAVTLKQGIIAGFFREGRFYTPTQLKHGLHDA